MSAPTKRNEGAEGRANGAPSATEVLPAYLEKSPVVQAVIRDLLKIARDDGLSSDERRWAEAAIQDALFRYRTGGPCKGGRVIPKEERGQLAGLSQVRARMDEEERVFAATLARLLERKNVSQAELARRVGVGASAISMMLSRRCRPQRRTVEKIAQALGVDLRELWPG